LTFSRSEWKHFQSNHGLKIDLQNRVIRAIRVKKQSPCLPGVLSRRLVPS
jgi:hypothetical protein